jgi:hypothetical protein
VFLIQALYQVKHYGSALASRRFRLTAERNSQVIGVQVHDRVGTVSDSLATIRVILLGVRAIWALRCDGPFVLDDLWEHIVICNDSRPCRMSLLMSEIKVSWLGVEVGDASRRLLLV